MSPACQKSSPPSVKEVSRMRLLIGVAFTGLCASTLISVAMAQSQPKLPVEVQQQIDESRKDCEPDKAVFQPGFITHRDFNEDGVDLYILNDEHLECGADLSSFCGSGGCSIQVFASNGDGKYAKVLDDLVQRVGFLHVKGRLAMHVDFGGAECGRANVEPCAETLFWNGSTFSPAN